jgi:hypothetical protein
MAAALTASHPVKLGLDPELGLVAAVLHQAFQDVRSRRVDIRNEALAVLAFTQDSCKNER